MSVKTNNIYGKILISNGTVERFISHVSMDCYGIVRFVSSSFFHAIVDFFKFGSATRGVKVHTSGDRIFVDVSVTVKYGVSIKAVIEALKESIIYKVERFTGMIVDTVNVTVIGVEK